VTYLKQTIAVGLCPHAASPYGVEDLIGNVLEWCLNEFVQPDGAACAPCAACAAWYFPYAKTERCAGIAAYLVQPRARFEHIGFRVVCSSPVPR